MQINLENSERGFRFFLSRVDLVQILQGVKRVDLVQILQGSSDFFKSNNLSKMLSAFLHPSPRNPKSGLKSRIHGSRTMHRAQHVIDMDAQPSCTSFMWTFSSTCFDKLFMSGPIPSNTLASTLEQSESSDYLEDTLEECVALINENDGFTLVYWYS